MGSLLLMRRDTIKRRAVSWAGPTVAQEFGNAVASGTTCAATATCTAGHGLICVAASKTDGTLGTWPTAPTGGGTWTLISQYKDGGFFGHVAAWWVPNITGGSTTVTVTAPATTTTGIAMSVLDIAGCNSVTPIDQSASATANSGTALASGTTGSAAATDLLVGLSAQSGSDSLDISGSTFSPAAATTTQATERYQFNCSVRIAYGNITGAQTEAFSSTLSFAGTIWGCWCLCVKV
jgi:hypothetical protein